MNKVRRSAWQGPLVAVALFGAVLNTVGSVGCSDDEEGANGGAGAAGSSTKGSGGSGTGGSGTGGSGTGGSGTGGSGTGGSGTGGSGTAGSGAGAAGSAGSGAGAGGEAGQAGSAGAGGGAAGQGGSGGSAGGAGQGGAGGSGPGFCATAGNSAFCSDFDGASPLEPGGLGWDAIEKNASTVELATSPVVSQPFSLHVASTEGERPSLVKTARPGGAFQIANATLDYDLYIDSLPTADGAGFGVSDFQFTEPDDLGFRLVVKATGEGALKEVHFEHNNPGQPYFDHLVEGAPVPLKAWTHVRVEAAFVLEGDASRVEVRLFLGGGATPAYEGVHPAPFAASPLARVRLVPFDFGKGYSIYYDNVSLVTGEVSPGARRPRARAGR